MDWIVARTQPTREKWASENIARQGYECYMPKVAVTRRIKGRAQQYVASAPLFPRYLFVLTPGPWSFLLGTYGVVGVVMNGGKPAVIPAAIIGDLRKREGADGLVALPTVTADYKKGQEVRIRDGVHAGIQGIYDGVGPQDRIRVLLDYLGRKTPVLIAGDHVEAVEPSM